MTATPDLGLQPVEVDGPDTDDLTLWSVTTIIGVLDKPALLYWAAEQTANAAIDSAATWQAMAEDEGRDVAVKWLRDARFRRPKTRLSDTALGSVVHAVCEAYALTGQKPGRDFVEHLITTEGGPQVDVDSETCVVGNSLNQFDGWLQRFTPSYQATEVAVYNPTYGYAGQADAFLTIDGVRFLGDYKGLDRSTPLPTPDGWSTIGAIQVGDRVFGRDGRPVTVTAKSGVHTNHCYRVTFDDTTSILCDDEHLWNVISTRDPSTEITCRTDKLPSIITRYGQRHLAIPMPQPLDLPAADLPIDPYVYGCWLGDGSRWYGTITKPDAELFDLIRARGYKVGETIDQRRMTRTVYGLRKKLRQADLLGHRTVPQQYLRGSVTQRLDLLRGLMDTDGSWNHTRSQAVFCTIDKATADMAYELVVGLGERPLINIATAHGFGRDVTAYQVTWHPRLHVPFTLSRKASGVVLSAGKSWRRMIVSVEPTLTVPTQCITVDAADGCYLAGYQMVPTHNSTRNPRDSQGRLKTPYPESVALQLAAYRNAEHAAVWRPRRFEKFRRRYYLLSTAERAMAVPVPEVDTGLVIQITPESCESYPIRCDDEVHTAFLYCLESFRWVQETSKTVLSQALTETR